MQPLLADAQAETLGGTQDIGGRFRPAPALPPNALAFFGQCAQVHPQRCNSPWRDALDLIDPFGRGRGRRASSVSRDRVGQYLLAGLRYEQRTDLGSARTAAHGADAHVLPPALLGKHFVDVGGDLEIGIRLADRDRRIAQLALAVAQR